MATTPAKLLRIARSIALTLPLAVAWLPVLAQSQSAGSSPALPPTPSQSAPQSPLQFEVATIRPHQSTGDEPSDRKMLPGGRFVATATSIRTLLHIAFGTDSISGAPNWVDNETFDINATTVNHAEVNTPQQFQQVILSLLEDRLALKFHRQGKEAPVYWLELEGAGKLGPDLKPSTADSQPSMSTNSSGSNAVMKVSKMSMNDIAVALSRQAGRPVEDHTGLKGNFDFQIEWAPEEGPESDDPSLFTVLKEHLGLKLQPAKGTTESIVIDQITHPSAN